jgi:hypothetical protein
LAVAPTETVDKGRLSDPAGYGRSEMEGACHAWKLVKRVWMTGGPTVITLPVDPIAISRGLGIRVVDDDELPPDVPGMLRKQAGFSDPEIRLNPIDLRARRRFTCAHSLGHYSRNVEMRRDGPWDIVESRDFFATPIGDSEETYATEFAAELLMPRAVPTSSRFGLIKSVGGGDDGFRR